MSAPFSGARLKRKYSQRPSKLECCARTRQVGLPCTPSAHQTASPAHQLHAKQHAVHIKLRGVHINQHQRSSNTTVSAAEIGVRAHTRTPWATSHSNRT